jgi:hypothetical protein
MSETLSVWDRCCSSLASMEQRAVAEARQVAAAEAAEARQVAAAEEWQERALAEETRLTAAKEARNIALAEAAAAVAEAGVRAEPMPDWNWVTASAASAASPSAQRLNDPALISEMENFIRESDGRRGSELRDALMEFDRLNSLDPGTGHLLLRDVQTRSSKNKSEVAIGSGGVSYPSEECKKELSACKGNSKCSDEFRRPYNYERASDKMKAVLDCFKKYNYKHPTDPGKVYEKVYDPVVHAWRQSGAGRKRKHTKKRKKRKKSKKKRSSKRC